jgi:hypothetical protein
LRIITRRRHHAGVVRGRSPWTLRGVGLAAGAVVALAVTPPAAAAPIEGTGRADIDPDKGVATARKRAIRRARRAALDTALSGVPGPVDKAARKAVRKRSEAWTGAYRILEQSDDGSAVTV